MTENNKFDADNRDKDPFGLFGKDFLGDLGKDLFGNVFGASQKNNGGIFQTVGKIFDNIAEDVKEETTKAKEVAERKIREAKEEAERARAEAERVRKEAQEHHNTARTESTTTNEGADMFTKSTMTTSFSSTGGGTVTINGRTYRGNNIMQRNGRIYIDGKDVTDENSDSITSGGILRLVIEGNISVINSTGDVEVHGNVNGKIETNGDVEVSGDVAKGVSTNGDVSVGGNVGGRISTNGDVNVGSNVRSA